MPIINRSERVHFYFDKFQRGIEQELLGLKCPRSLRGWNQQVLRQMSAILSSSTFLTQPWWLALQKLQTSGYYV